MTNYLMDIMAPTGSITFDITPKFFPVMRFNWKRSGHEVSVIDTIPVEGWFSENDQDVLLAKWDLLRTVAHSKAPATFIFRKDTGGIIYQLSAGHIQNLESVEQGGGFVNHVQFRFNIEEERGVTIGGIVDVSRSDEEVEEVDDEGRIKKTRRREASATGQHGNLANAKSFVMNQKPSGRIIRETLRSISYDGVFSAVWDVDDSQKDDEARRGGLRLWRERATLTPGQRSHRFYRTYGAPVLLQGGMGETRLSVTGYVEAYEKSAFPTPNSIITYYEGAVVGAITEKIQDSPSWGSPYPIKYDVDAPTLPYIWAMDYSFSLLYGEAGPEQGTRIRPAVRFAGSEGAEAI